MSDMKCSSCGAGFDAPVGGYCQYCGSFVKLNNSDTPSSGHYTAKQSPSAKLQAAQEAIKSAEQRMEYFFWTNDVEVVLRAENIQSTNTPPFKHPVLLVEFASVNMLYRFSLKTFGVIAILPKR